MFGRRSLFLAKKTAQEVTLSVNPFVRNHISKLTQGWLAIVQGGQGWSKMVKDGEGWAKMVNEDQGCRARLIIGFTDIFSRYRYRYIGSDITNIGISIISIGIC